MQPFPDPLNPEPYILLVDDDRHIRLYLKSRLAFLGAHIHMVLDGREGMEVLSQRRPHLILSDAVMPRVDGFEFCRQAKADPEIARIPFVLLTSLSQNLRERSLQVGADDYLSKGESDLIFRIRTRLLLRLGMHGAASLQERFPDRAPTLLVVSKSSAIQTQMLTFLSKDGIQVVGLPSPGMVLDHLAGRRADALVVDLEQGVDTLAVLLGNLRNHPDYASLPVMVLASAGEQDQLAAVETDIQDRLLKPVDSQDTRHRVKLLLRLA